MNYLALLSSSVWALLRNKMRSLLTVLGITIGIAAVICVVAIGRAGQARVEQQLNNLGDNFVWIEAGSRAPSGVRTGSHGTTRLTVPDALAIGGLPEIKRVTPNVDGRAMVIYGNRNWPTHWRGINTDYFDIRHWDVALGAPFLEEDVRRARSVVLLGQTVREQLFGAAADPIGQVLRVNAQLFQVVGVLQAKGPSAFGQDQDDTIILPWTTAQQKLRGRNQSWLDDILCSAVSASAVAPAIEQVTLLLRERHHIRPGAEDDFNIRRPDEIIKAQIETSHTLETLLISIAFISLVVGGIGIMNVMLVSVAERTREIGIRLAVGASEWAVQAQFLGEAVALSVFGGLLGIGLGVAGSMFLARFLGWSMVVPPDAVAVAPLFSALVGVFFGFYPARLAARMDPIDALRHE